MKDCEDTAGGCGEGSVSPGQGIPEDSCDD